ncbi:universal stress protein [Thermococcus sp.]|uniref:universal stress protein n=1 Tax=Thermococcus sp. TaxID=35749 RepID=UPI00261EFCBD|nr:universal stress protein [Thermococcus sp.]
MVNFGELILRKFQNIAGSRYEEIVKAYQEFFLTEEEMKIPVISSVLLTIDRFSQEPPDELYEVLVSYKSATVRVVYIIDSALCTLIRETLGEDEAREFREKEEGLGREVLEKISRKLSELEMYFTTELIFEEKAPFVEEAVEEHDLLMISRHFGSESLKTHNISPLVFRIVQGIEKPVIVY